MNARVVTPATPADVDAVASLIARSFGEDPLLDRLFPGRARAQQIRRFTDVQVANLRGRMMGRGMVLVARDREGVPVATAVWAPPVRPTPYVGRLLDALPGFLSVGTDLLPTLRTEQTYHRYRPRTPHWYLNLFAVDHAHRGTGMGSAVMRASLAHVDATHQPAWLEASLPHLVPLYEHFGWRPVVQLPAVGGSTPTGMERAARGTPAAQPRP